MQSGDIVNHKQMGEMIIQEVREDKLEVCKKEDEEKQLKNIYVISIDDFDISDKPKEKKSKQSKEKEVIPIDSLEEDMNDSYHFNEDK